MASGLNIVAEVLRIMYNILVPNSAYTYKV